MSDERGAADIAGESSKPLPEQRESFMVIW